jgi:hypothetical protein
MGVRKQTAKRASASSPATKADLAALRELITTNVATKVDLAATKADLALFRDETRAELALVREEMATKDDLRAQGVLVERIQDDIRMVSESVLSLGERNDRRFDDVERELRSLRAEVARHADVAALAALEQRVAAIERHVGL